MITDLIHRRDILYHLAYNASIDPSTRPPVHPFIRPSVRPSNDAQTHPRGTRNFARAGVRASTFPPCYTSIKTYLRPGGERTRPRPTASPPPCEASGLRRPLFPLRASSSSLSSSHLLSSLSVSVETRLRSSFSCLVRKSSFLLFFSLFLLLPFPRWLDSAKTSSSFLHPQRCVRITSR